MRYMIQVLVLMFAVSGCAHGASKDGARFGSLSGGPGAGPTGLLKNEDDAHASGDKLVAVACRRIDTAATSAGTSGDYATLDCDELGYIRVNPRTPTTFYMGQLNIDTGGTEEALGSSQAITQGCLVKSPAANTGLIYVGTNPVTSSTGYILGDDQEVWISTDNVADIYVDVATNNDDASYVCY